MEQKKPTNKYGLSRTIPENVKRQIRINSGFGCVICGLGIIHYEHVDPEYHEAHIHDPSKMTLLCPGCHGKVTTGMWSKEKVKKAMNNPKSLSDGYSREVFDIGNGHPEIHFAGSVLKNCPIPIMIRGLPVFQIIPSEEAGLFLLSARFYDSQGNNTFSIFENEWFASIDNWDVTVIGNTLTIREGLGNIGLQLTSHPPDTLIVKRVHMLIQGLLVIGNENEFQIINPLNGRKSIYSECIMNNCPIGFSID